MIPRTWLRRPFENEFRRSYICNGQSLRDRMMYLDSERSSFPETCMNCPISWITWLPRGRQLATSVEHLVQGSDLKGSLIFRDLKISSAICLGIFEVVDDYYNMGQYLNLAGPEFSLPLSFSFYDFSNLAKTIFWRQMQRTVMKSHRVYRMVAAENDRPYKKSRACHLTRNLLVRNFVWYKVSISEFICSDIYLDISNIVDDYNIMW